MSAICVLYAFTLCGALPAQEPAPAGAPETGLFRLASEIPLETGVNSVSYGPDGTRQNLTNGRIGSIDLAAQGVETSEFEEGVHPLEIRARDELELLFGLV